MNNVDTPGVSPEMEVLLWSIRVDGQGDDRLQDLFKTVDRGELYRLAQSHQLTAFLYHRLKNIPASGNFHDLDLRFSKVYISNIYRNLVYTRQLVWLLQLLTERGIQAIPFKGIVLAQQAYGTSDLRQCGDIDILIWKKNLPEVISILQEAGMHPGNAGTSGNKLYLNIKRSIEFSAKNRISIDLHWGIFDKFTGFPAADVYFRNAGHIRINGIDFPSFSPEDTLVLLAVHGTKHLWENLRWIGDVIYFLHTNQDLDVQSALSTAESLHCRRMLITTLQLVKSLGGLHYPDPVQQIINNEKPALSLAEDILPVIRTGTMPSALEQVRILAKSRERWLDAIGFALFAVSTSKPPSGFSLRLPLLLRPLYALIQPLWHMFRR